MGIPFHFCSLIFYMLEQLKLFIRDGHELSSHLFSTNGVPQGDAISPLLFSLFISDLPSHLDFEFPRLNNVEIGYLLYADDLVVLADSKSELQKAINSVVSYCNSNNLVINASKTQYLVFHKGSLPRDSDVFLDGEKIPRTNSVQYLGFNFSSQLRFSAHVDNLCSKANSRIGYLFSKLPLSRLPIPIIKLVFHTYILPIFRYGLCLYFPFCSDRALSKIDAVYSKFLKRYLRVPKHSNNELVYLIAESEPLIHTLKNELQKSFLSLSFPSHLTGFRPALAEFIPDSISSYQASDHVPQYYQLDLIPHHIPTDPSHRHKLLKLCFDSMHYHLCSDTNFHKVSDICSTCICKFCGLHCHLYHYQSCVSFSPAT